MTRTEKAEQFADSSDGGHTTRRLLSTGLILIENLLKMTRKEKAASPVRKAKKVSCHRQRNGFACLPCLDAGFFLIMSGYSLQKLFHFESSAKTFQKEVIHLLVGNDKDM